MLSDRNNSVANSVWMTDMIWVCVPWLGSIIDEMVSPICMPMIWPLNSTAAKMIWVMNASVRPIMTSLNASRARLKASDGTWGSATDRVGKQTSVIMNTVTTFMRRG